jgi:hypothetical protein
MTKVTKKLPRALHYAQTGAFAIVNDAQKSREKISMM